MLLAHALGLHSAQTVDVSFMLCYGFVQCSICVANRSLFDEC